MSLKGEFLEYLESKVGRSLYVWGAQGQSDISEAWIRRREDGNEANVARVLALWEKLHAAGIEHIEAYDCSGLVMHFVQDIKGLSASDMSAAGLFDACTEIGRYDMQPGDLVFRHNGQHIHHVGVYVGDDMAIEAKGRDDGVVKRAMDASGPGYWNRCGRLKLLERAMGDEASFARCAGGSVNVRSEGSPEGKVLAVAHAGDKLLVLAGDAGWSRVAAAISGRLVLGFMKNDYIRTEEEE